MEIPFTVEEIKIHFENRLQAYKNDLALELHTLFDEKTSSLKAMFEESNIKALKQYQEASIKDEALKDIPFLYEQSKSFTKKMYEDAIAGNERLLNNSLESMKNLLLK